MRKGDYTKQDKMGESGENKSGKDPLWILKRSCISDHWQAFEGMDHAKIFSKELARGMVKFH